VGPRFNRLIAFLKRIRHVLLLFGAVVVLVALVEPAAFSGPVPLISRLDGPDRVDLYKLITTVTASLLGFLIASVAILVTLDINRIIVEQLRRGEAFSLLIINLLAAILFLFLTTVGGVIGAIVDDGTNGADLFECLYEVSLLTSLLELGLGGFYFALVTYKVAAND
jgi:hypothetical protein